MYVYMYLYSLSNSRWHSAKAIVIADVKGKIIVSRWHFFADVIFSGTSKFKTIKILISKQTCAQYLFQRILNTFLNIYALLFIFRKLWTIEKVELSLSIVAVCHVFLQ